MDHPFSFEENVWEPDDLHILLKAAQPSKDCIFRAERLIVITLRILKYNNSPEQKHKTGLARPGFITALPWKAVCDANPSAPSKRPTLNAEVESALDAAHAFLYIKSPCLLHFSELAWWCHLLMTAASLSNLSPSALGSNSFLNPARSTEQRVPMWLCIGQPNGSQSSNVGTFFYGTVM